MLGCGRWRVVGKSEGLNSQASWREWHALCFDAILATCALCSNITVATERIDSCKVTGPSITTCFVTHLQSKWFAPAPSFPTPLPSLAQVFLLQHSCFA